MATAQSVAQLIYSNEWTRIFVRFARETFGGVTDAQALAEDARQRLALNLTRLEMEEGGRELTRAYLFVAFKHALVDAYREWAGRPVPRKWLREYGVLGERLFELHCLLRLTTAEVLAALRDDRGQAGEPAVDEAEVRRLLREMERRQECDGRTGEPLSLDATNEEGRTVVETMRGAGDPVDCATRDQAATLREWLFGAGRDGLPAAWREHLDILTRRGDVAPLDLDDDDCFILRCFRDQIPERRVGELLGGLTVRQVRYRRQQILDKLRRGLAAARITLDDLID